MMRVFSLPPVPFPGQMTRAKAAILVRGKVRQGMDLPRETRFASICERLESYEPRTLLRLQNWARGIFLCISASCW